MKKLLFLALICWVFYSCSSVPITGRKQLNLVSDSEVLSLSLQEYKSYIDTAKKSTDQAATAMVKRVGQKIADAVEYYYELEGMKDMLNGYSWEFNLIDDPSVNAFCMPGGKIVVYTGILPYTQDEAGLAVVLGHEVAHAVAKHSNERMSQQIAAQYGGAAVDALLSGKSETVQTVGSVGYALGTQLGVLLPFNRKQELEADHLGLIFMAIADYDPNAAIPFWQRMSQQGGSNLEFLSTHPSDGNRITQIQKELPIALQIYNNMWVDGNTAKPTTTTPKSNTSEEWRF
jgi:Putative Zn-dependent protease, contains TPR repeats